MNKLYNRSVTIRDKNMIRWTIDFEVRETEPRTKRNFETFEEFTESFEVSMCGNGGNSCGQCYDRIIPRTPNQQELLNFWKKYHLCGMQGGTKEQEEYLKSEQYQEDYSNFVKLFSGYDDELRQNFDETSFSVLCQYYHVNIEFIPTLRSVLVKYVQSNPIKYILGFGKYCSGHGEQDLYVRYIFLAIKGLYIDRGYKYGTDWLYRKIPDNICQMIDELCEALQKEENELTKELSTSDDFDMSGNFNASSKMVEMVMDIRNCDEDEAKRFLALGMHLECTFGDLDDTFKELDCEQQLYCANGTEYYIGTDDELSRVAHDRVYDDGDYEYLWREAVAAKKTTDSLNDWLEQVLQDGWCSILNSWDGRYESYCVADEWICVSRT